MPQKFEIGSVNIIANISTGTVEQVKRMGTVSYMSRLGTVAQVRSGTLDVIRRIGSIVTMRQIGTLLYTGRIGTVNRINFMGSAAVKSGTVDVVRRLGSLTYTGRIGTVNRINFMGSAAVKSGTVDVVRRQGTLTYLSRAGTVADVRTGTIARVNRVGTIGLIGNIRSVNSGTIWHPAAQGGNANAPRGSIWVKGTSVTILATNNTRRAGFITNVGGSALYLGFGTAASRKVGLRVAGITSVINDTGDVFEINQTKLWRGTVTGISAGSAVLVLYTQY